MANNKKSSSTSSEMLQYKIEQLEKSTQEINNDFSNDLSRRIDIYLADRGKNVDRWLTIVGFFAAVFGIIIPILLSIAGMNLYSQIEKAKTDSVAALDKIKNEFKNIQLEKDSFEKYKKEISQEFKKLRKKLENDRTFVENARKAITKSKNKIAGYTKSTKGEYDNVKKQVEIIKSLTDIAKKAAIQAEYNRLITDADNFFKNKRYKEAIEAFNKTLVISKKNAMLFNNLATAYFVLKQYPQAIECYNKAIAINANDAMLYSNRANVKIKMKQFNSALSDYEKAISLWHNNTTKQKNISQESEAIDFNIIPGERLNINHFYGNKGSVLLLLKKYQDAMHNYEKAIEIIPYPAKDYIYWGLGSAQIHLGLYKNAIKNFKKAINLNPKNFKIYTNYGIALLKLEKYQDAINILSRAINLKPNNETAYYQRAYAEIELNRLDKASEDILMSIKIKPTSSAYANKATLDCRLNKINDALDSISYAIKLSPKVSRLYLARAAICLLKNSPDWEQALLDVNKVSILDEDDKISSYLPAWREILKQIKEKKTINSDEISSMLQNVKNKDISLSTNISLIVNKYAKKKNYNLIQRLFFNY
jgi:tetratricopeptide (TPR) repeat protein